MQSATPPAGHSTVRLGPCDYHGAEDTAFLAAAGPPPPASTRKSQPVPRPPPSLWNPVPQREVQTPSPRGPQLTVVPQSGLVPAPSQSQPLPACGSCPGFRCQPVRVQSPWREERERELNMPALQLTALRGSATCPGPQAGLVEQWQHLPPHLRRLLQPAQGGSRRGPASPPPTLQELTLSSLLHGRAAKEKPVPGPPQLLADAPWNR